MKFEWKDDATFDDRVLFYEVLYAMYLDWEREIGESPNLYYRAIMFLSAQKHFHGTSTPYPSMDMDKVSEEINNSILADPRPMLSFPREMVSLSQSL